MNTAGATFSWCSETGVQAGELLQSHGTALLDFKELMYLDVLRLRICSQWGSIDHQGLQRHASRPWCIVFSVHPLPIAGCEDLNGSTAAAQPARRETICVLIHQVATPAPTLSAVGPAMSLCMLPVSFRLLICRSRSSRSSRSVASWWPEGLRLHDVGHAHLECERRSYKDIPLCLCLCLWL